MRVKMNLRYNVSIHWRWMKHCFQRCHQSRPRWASHLSTYLNNKRSLFFTHRHDPEEDVEIACFPTEPREPRLSPPGSHPRHDRPQIPPTVRRWFPGLCLYKFSKEYSWRRYSPKSSLKNALPSLRFVRMMLRLWCSRANAAPRIPARSHCLVWSYGERESARLMEFDSMHRSERGCSFSRVLLVLQCDK